MGSARRQWWVYGVIALTLICSAWFCASAASATIASLIPNSVVTPALDSEKPSFEDAMSKEARYNSDDILAYNMFDHQLIDMHLAPVDEPDDSEEEGEEVDMMPEDGNLPICGGKMKLISALMFDKYPHHSMAQIEDEEGKIMNYREGMTAGSYTVGQIDSMAVSMRAGKGKLCQLKMFDDEEPEDKSKSKKEPKLASKGSKKSKGGTENRSGLSTKELDENISKISSTQYNVNRSLIDKVMNDQASLMRTARIRPYKKDGKTVGVKMYGIRSSGLLGKLGMKNGDMLKTINGYNMSAPAKALEAYTKLQSATDLTIEIERHGKPLTLNYNIQ